MLLLVLTACSLPAPAATLTATPLPLYRQVTLDKSAIEDQGKKPDYILKADVPVLKGVDDPRVRVFNAAMAALVMAEIDSFKSNVATLPAEPISAGSSFDMTFTLVSPPGDILSLNFGVYVYSDGAAHPFGYAVTYTYDLERGEQVSLEQLFRPGSDYLGLIATWCRDDLTQRNVGFLEYGTQGVDPLPENFRNWNITPAGLMITFDPYQVAPYASGPQVVTIPYDALKSVIDPEGPLGNVE